MADKEVLFKVRVDGSDASRNLKQVAGDTKALGDAAEKTQRQLTVAEEAQRRVAAGRRETAVKAEMARLRPEPPPLPFDPVQKAREQIEERRKQNMVSAEQWRQTPWMRRDLLGQGGLSGAARAAAPYAAGLYAGGKFIEAGAAATREHGELSAERMRAGGGQVSGNEVANSFVRSLAEGIPVVGNLVRSFAELASAGNKTAALMAGAALHNVQRMGTVQRFEMGQAGNLGRRMYDVNMGGVDADALARAHGSYVDSLTPGRLAEFAGPYGDVKEQAAQAGIGVEAARSGVEARQKELQKTLAELARAEGTDVKFGKLSDVEAEAAKVASRAKQKWLEGTGNNTTMQTTGQKLDQAESMAMLGAASAADVDKTAAANFQDKAATVEKQLTDLKQKQLELSQAELNQRRAMLAINEQIAQSSRSGAVQLGGGSPGEAQTLVQLAKQFQQSGLDGLAPEHIAMLEGYAPLTSVIQDAKKRRGAAMQEESGLNQLVGEITGNAQAAKPLAEQEAEARKSRAKSEGQAAREQSDIAEGYGRQMADILSRVMNSVIAGFRRELEAKDKQEALVRKAQ